MARNAAELAAERARITELRSELRGARGWHCAWELHRALQAQAATAEPATGEVPVAESQEDQPVAAAQEQEAEAQPVVEAQAAEAQAAEVLTVAAEAQAAEALDGAEGEDPR
jgi:hypothetical protein